MTRTILYDKITTVINNLCYLWGEIVPAKKQITKENILDAALEIVRKSGIEALNMRSLAQACNCSTQPIYLSFANSEQLKYELAIKTVNFFNAFIENVIKSGKYLEYKSVGMGYILFAKEEPNLFKFILMNEGEKKQGLEEMTVETSVQIIMRNYGITHAQAYRLHIEMWLFVHGVATMCMNGYLGEDMQGISDMVTDVFNGLIVNIKGENK